MQKSVGLYAKRADMSPEAFFQRYEYGHVPLIKEVLPGMGIYTRSYPLRVLVLRPGEKDIGFGSITQIWQRSEADSARTMELMQDPRNSGRIAEDELALFDRAGLLSYPAEELGQAPPPGVTGPKVVILYDKIGDASTEVFQEQAEHALLGPLLDRYSPTGRPLVVASRRSYAIPHEGYHLPTHQKAFQVVPDALYELWLDDDAALNAFAAMVGQDGASISAPFASVRVVAVVQEFGGD